MNFHISVMYSLMFNIWEIWNVDLEEITYCWKTLHTLAHWQLSQVPEYLFENSFRLGSTNAGYIRTFGIPTKFLRLPWRKKLVRHSVGKEARESLKFHLMPKVEHFVVSKWTNLLGKIPQKVSTGRPIRHLLLWYLQKYLRPAEKKLVWVSNIVGMVILPQTINSEELRLVLPKSSELAFVETQNYNENSLTPICTKVPSRWNELP